MNRNTEMHFSQLPTLEISRSKFNMGHTHITTANASELVPCYVDCDIVPGDTVTMRQSEIIRMMTPIAPVMDNAFMDFYWFFIPNRLVWNNWKMCMGENETAPWTQTVEKTIPQIKMDNKHEQTYGGKQNLTCNVLKGSVLDHMGIPIQNDWTYSTGATTDKEIQISSLPTKAYVLCWNEFFRDENLQNPCSIDKSDSTTLIMNKQHNTYRNNPESATVQNEQYGGLPCLKVCRPHDYFSSCLPGAQKGPAVTIPLSEEKAPVKFTYLDSQNDWMDAGVLTIDRSDVTSSAPYKNKTGAIYGANGTDMQTAPFKPDMTDAGNEFALTTGDYYQLFTDLSAATGATINQLRQAFAIQKFYERDARGGTRYIESIWSHFRVRNPDYRLQRPEYLGGFRQNINMNQVIQNSPTVESSTPLGTTGAYSITSHQSNDVFSHSFTEHGILLGMFCIRTEHTYCQGINRMWFKKKRLDFYSPEFANLSEQAVLNQEIYAQGTSTDKEAFGYQEAWAEMRYKPNICSGEMSLKLSDSLGATWTYADKYESLPQLGDKWIQETDANLQRTLAVQDHDQFLLDIYFEPIYTRPLPLYSVPGLIDHH